MRNTRGVVWVIPPIVAATVVSIWWHGSSAYLTAPFAGSAWIAFGRLAGLFAQIAILLELILVARIPFLEHRFGFVAMNRVHRVIGGWLAILIVIHPLMLAVGYGDLSIIGTWIQFVSFLVDWENVVLAFVGTALLMIGAVLSARGLRRRMPYEAWHAVHLGMYAAAVAIFVHQLQTGDMAASPVSYGVWVALNASALGAIFTFRVVRPIAYSIRYRFVDRVVGSL